jgi:hypothetical protein
MDLASAGDIESRLSVNPIPEFWRAFVGNNFGVSAIENVSDNCDTFE